MTDYTELRAVCERIAAERHKNPGPYEREAVLARVTLGLLDRLERYNRLSKWMQYDWDCNDRLFSGGCDCGFQAALNQTEAQNA